MTGTTRSGRRMPRCALAVAALGSALGAAALVSAQAPSSPPASEVHIIAPAEGSYVSGPTELRVRIDPAGTASAVTFFIDGRQVCALTHEPFACEWDAGPIVSEHQVRAVATLSRGGRVVQTLRTKGLGYTERVDVDVVQVTVTVSDG